jgi:hypothetical protein
MAATRSPVRRSEHEGRFLKQKRCFLRHGLLAGLVAKLFS